MFDFTNDGFLAWRDVGRGLGRYWQLSNRARAAREAPMVVRAYPVGFFHIVVDKKSVQVRYARIRTKENVEVLSRALDVAYRIHDRLVVDGRYQRPKQSWEEEED